MTIKLHHEINGAEDSFILSGDTVSEIRLKAVEWYKSRGIDMVNPDEVEKYKMWSEKLSD